MAQKQDATETGGETVLSKPPPLPLAPIGAAEDVSTPPSSAALVAGKPPVDRRRRRTKSCSDLTDLVRLSSTTPA